MSSAKSKPRGRRGASAQMRFAFRTWGGRRPGSGRKPTHAKAGVAHRARPEHDWREPVHVTMRARRNVPSLRSQVAFLSARKALSEASGDDFRILHFSFQVDHLHLLV